MDTEEDIFSSEEIETDSDVEGEIFSSGEENEITSEPEVESEDEEQVEAFSAESYMAAEIGDISNGYHIGNLTVPIHTDTNGNVFIGIDNSLYPVSDNFDFSNIQGIIGSDNKEGHESPVRDHCRLYPRPSGRCRRPGSGADQHH